MRIWRCIVEFWLEGSGLVEYNLSLVIIYEGIDEAVTNQLGYLGSLLAILIAFTLKEIGHIIDCGIGWCRLALAFLLGGLLLFLLRQRIEEVVNQGDSTTVALLRCLALGTGRGVLGFR